MHEAPTMVVDDECVRLERMAASKDRALARRAKVVLLANQGMTDAQIGDALGISRKTAWRWRTRFAAGGIAQIECERPRSGRRMASAFNEKLGMFSRCSNPRPS